MNRKREMKYKTYWLLVSAVYFYAAFWLLWNYGGPAADGAGYTPGLSLPGFKPPLVSVGEYVESWNVRFQYRLPYLVVAFVFTILGCNAANQLVRRSSRLAAHPSGTSFAVALLLLLLGPVVMDLGGRLNLWKTPTWFEWDLTDSIRLLVMVFLPLALLSALGACGARRFARR